MRCPTCGAISPGIRFCERDGTRLVSENVLTATAATTALTCVCGSASFDDGFCTVCGRAYPRANSTFDHVEQAPVPELGGVSDRGKRHGWNEDALSLAAETLNEAVHVLVVCDGVSSSRDAQRAAQVAAETTRATLLDCARSDADPTRAMHQAVLAAHEAICDLPQESHHSAGPALARVDPSKSQPPGCTLVAALVRNGRATIGWVGDSRAYRFGPDLTQLLTHDHSWFNAVVESGEMTPAEAAASPNCNAILQAVGPLNYDEGDQPEPPKADVVNCDLLPGHLLLLCSDGLWKYAPEPSQLAELVRQQPSGTAPLDLSRHLIEFANTRGGTDNITAAILSRR